MKNVSSFLFYQTTFLLSNTLCSEFEKIHQSQTASIVMQEGKIKKEIRGEIIDRIKLSGLKNLYKPLVKFYGEGEALCCCLPCLQVTLIPKNTEDKKDTFMKRYINKFKGLFDIGLNPIVTTAQNIDAEYTKYITEFQEETFNFSNFSEVLLKSDREKKKKKYQEIIAKMTDESSEKEHITQAVKNLADKIDNDSVTITLTAEEKYEIRRFLAREYQRLLVEIDSSKEKDKGSSNKADQKDDRLISTKAQSDISTDPIKTIEETYRELKINELFEIEKEKAAIETQKEKSKNFLAKTYYYVLWKIGLSEKQETKIYKREDEYKKKKRALEEKIKAMETIQRELEVKDTWKRKTEREVFLTKLKLKMNEDFLKLFVNFYKKSEKISYVTKFLIWTCPFKNEEKSYDSWSESCCSYWWFNPKTTIKEQLASFYSFYHDQINETEESSFVDISLFKNQYISIFNSEEDELFCSVLTKSERLQLSYELDSLMHLLVE